MKKISVAMVAACPFPANRGTPSRILGMAEGLAKLGHNVCVVTYHFGTNTETKRIEIHRTPQLPYQHFAPGPTMSKLLILDPFLFSKLLKVVIAKKIDLIHAHHFEGALVGYLVRKLTKVKVIYDAHTTLGGELSFHNFINVKSLVNFLDNKVPKWSDHIITTSNTLQEFMLSIDIDKNKIDVIPTGANIEQFEGHDPNIIRSRYKLQGKSIVMYTGSMAGFQRVDYLIEAMKKVFNNYSNVVLVLVGNSDIEKIKNICIEKGILDRVIMTGERPFCEIPLFLSSADVVVSPRTVCPGGSQKLSNYMAAQKPIVSFEGSAELLVNGYNGLIVENGNTAAMASSIMTLLKKRGFAEKLGNNAKTTLTAKYDWGSLCQKLERVYYKILKLQPSQC